MDIKLVLDVSISNIIAQTTELTMQKLNDYLWDNPAPAPASDNSDIVDDDQILEDTAQGSTL
jgi:hypothetical protein